MMKRARRNKESMIERVSLKGILSD